MTTAVYHKPVLLAESLRLLQVPPAGTIVDATFGGGGHARAILQALGTEGRLLAFDRDPDAAHNAPADPRFELIPMDFRHLSSELAARGIQQIDGLLADLGVSSHQFDTPARGFSFRTEAPLDMRMNPEAELSAADLLNNYPAEDIARVLYEYGELRRSRAMARALAAARSRRPFGTTADLEAALTGFLPPSAQAKFLAKVYQALRIEVNDELRALRELLAQTPALLRPHGRLVVLSYHSLEDRLVKRFLRSGTFSPEVPTDAFGQPLSPWHVLTRRPVEPNDEEIAANPRARSARLRAAERLEPSPQQPAVPDSTN